MRNISNKVAMKPRSALSLSGINAALYSCTENTGTTLTDAFDLAASAAIGGTAGTQLTSTPGWLTLNGSDNYVNLPASLFPAILAGQAHVFAFNLFHAADNGTTETIIDIGSNSTTDGIFRLSVNAAGGLQLSTRGVGGSANTAQTFGTFDMTAYNGVAAGVSAAIVLRSISGLTATADLYVNNAFVSSLSVDVSQNSGTAWPRVVTNNYVRLGALVGTASTFLGGGTATSRIRNILSYRQMTYNTVSIAQAIRQHHLFPGEKIRYLT